MVSFLCLVLRRGAAQALTKLPHSKPLGSSALRPSGSLFLPHSHPPQEFGFPPPALLVASQLHIAASQLHTGHATPVLFAALLDCRADPWMVHVVDRREQSVLEMPPM